MLKYFFKLSHASSKDARRRLCKVINSDRQNVLCGNKAERMKKEVLSVLCKYSKGSECMPEITLTQTNDSKCILAAKVLL